MTAPPSAEEVGRPDHAPAQRQAVWLSSEDVKAAIVRLAETGTDKAACWDFTAAINHLIGETR